MDARGRCCWGDQSCLSVSFKRLQNILRVRTQRPRKPKSQRGRWPRGSVNLGLVTRMTQPHKSTAAGLRSPRRQASSGAAKPVQDQEPRDLPKRSAGSPQIPARPLARKATGFWNVRFQAPDVVCTRGGPTSPFGIPDGGGDETPKPQSTHTYSYLIHSTLSLPRSPVAPAHAPLLPDCQGEARGEAARPACANGLRRFSAENPRVRYPLCQGCVCARGARVAIQNLNVALGVADLNV
ncbi:uncharacterized protein LOC125158837 isoform X2 [Prionailurus viverrinus]|uniref:uncharacterized protein LOC125158837 isoform X2 n=1 Tax=Prionailurus viverrinus TaxID=61388 RepID=UPI001FF380B1|nr:uncharacterized protein LOC125158837 isoform X2 [Prionailurus viverrinus]